MVILAFFLGVFISATLFLFLYVIRLERYISSFNVDEEYEEIEETEGE